MSPGRSCFFLFLKAGVKTSPGLTSSLLFQGTGLIQSPRLPTFPISSAGLKTSTTYQLFPISRSWGKNVPRTFLLFLISRSRGKNIHWMFQLSPVSGSWGDTVSQTVSLLHKAVEDFFNHVPFIF